MTRYKVDTMTQAQRVTFLEWIIEQDMDPGEIVDNGRLSVHNGRISGTKFVKSDATGEYLQYGGKPVQVPFIYPQKTLEPDLSK